RLAQAWQLELPNAKRFDASALLLTPSGLLTISDREPVLYRIALTNAVSARLELVSSCFSSDQLRNLAPLLPSRLDCEGLARDAQGRIYISEESQRWILRCSPVENKLERLNIDWSPV